MTPVQELLRRAVSELETLGYEYALIGGLAVSARTQPRFTADVDLVVSVTGDAEAEALIHELRHRGWQIGALVEQEDTLRLATVRLLDAEEGSPIVDLLFASSGIEPEIVGRAEVLEIFPNLKVRVARLSDLVVLKLLSRDDNRPQDQADLQALVAAAPAPELRAAAAAAALVEERGFARGRDLSAALAELIASRQGPQAP